MDNDICMVCGSSSKTLAHMSYNCSYAKQVWPSVNQHHAIRDQFVSSIENKWLQTLYVTMNMLFLCLNHV